MTKDCSHYKVVCIYVFHSHLSSTLSGDFMPVMSTDFVADLRRMSEKAIGNADMATHIDEVKKECSKTAAKGFTNTSVSLFDCLFTPQEVASEVKLLGLRVLEARKSSQGVHLDISWKGDNTARATKKQRLYLTQDFTIKLRDQTDKAICAADMTKHVDTVREECSETAAKGFTKTTVYLSDCLFTPQEVASEVELLGLRVLEARKGYQGVYLGVSWEKTVDTFQPKGLERGNLSRSCCICLQTEVMCRLHPCGHLIGQSCAKGLLGKKCPCCRDVVRFAHVIFEP
jgi:hypothetical protein